MRRAIRWTLRTVGGLVALVLLAALVIGLIGRARLQRTYEAPAALVAASADPGAVVRGEHLVRINGCAGCHGEGLGGKLFLDIPPARVTAPNLTRGRGGVGARYGARDWDRAVRYGVRVDGRMILPFMPWRLYNRLGDQDAAAIAAYLRALPPIDNEPPPTRVRVPGYLMLGLMPGEELRPDVSGPRAPAPPPGETAAYGKYLASVACAECHGDDLRGGKHPAPEAPPGPSLVNAGGWPRDAFARAVRTGVAPGGRVLDAWMPAKPQFSALTDQEVGALHAYLATLPAAPPAQAAGAKK